MTLSSDEIPLAPEYPSLSAAERAEGADSRLAKSRRKFLGSATKVPAQQEWLEEVIGGFGDFKHAVSSGLDAWLQAWSMPHTSEAGNEAQSSSSVFVGLAESSEMPSVSRLHPWPPYITLTSHFVHTCSRISEIFPVFARLVASSPSLQNVGAARDALFEHFHPSTVPSPDLLRLIRETRDPLFSVRTTAAAVRWAIAHEMAHAVVGPKQRRDAYAKVADFYPHMEKGEWFPKRSKLPHFDRSLELYRDEIACDLLAIDFVLASPFAHDDLITQVSGSLLALDALRWDGWFQDGSALSETHPSPTLRFRIVLEAWIEKLTDPETWKSREAPGAFGLEDIAHWAAFEQWGSGAYREGRRGKAWEQDIESKRRVLLDSVPSVVMDQIYLQNEHGIFRLPKERR